MGRKSRNKTTAKKRGGKSKPPKRQKRRRFWVEDVCESRPAGLNDVVKLRLHITRADLQDGFCAPMKKSDSLPEDPPAVDNTSSTDGTRKSQQDRTPSADKDIANSTGAGTDNSQHDMMPSAKVQQHENGSETAATQGPDADGISNHAWSFSISKSDHAKTRYPQYSYANSDFTPLPHGDCGDGVTNPHSTESVPDKFWAQRHRLFSKFDEGIQLDSESWYSVTPEAIASHIAQRMVVDAQIVVLDPFCGCGGNTIAFARRPEVSLVVAVDSDRSKLLLAAHNASIYGIPSSKICFIHGDACDVMSRYKGGILQQQQQQQGQLCPEAKEKETHGSFCISDDVADLPPTIHCIFLSPPWGGPEYLQCGPKNFDLSVIQVGNDKDETFVDGTMILQMAFAALPAADQSVVYFLPRNTNGRRMAIDLLNLGYTGYAEMEQTLLNGKFKSISVYFGSLAKIDGDDHVPP